MCIYIYILCLFDQPGVAPAWGFLVVSIVEWLTWPLIYQCLIAESQILLASLVGRHIVLTARTSSSPGLGFPWIIQVMESLYSSCIYSCLSFLITIPIIGHFLLGYLADRSKWFKLSFLLAVMSPLNPPSNATFHLLCTI